jgi:hypothetical protein
VARARNIKPDLYLDEDLAELPLAARYMYPGLWMIADREGRLEDRPKKIKAVIYPYESQPVDSLLQKLADSGHIIRYEVEGKRYIQIVTFLKHQNPHKKEKESEIPAYDPSRETPSNYSERPGNSGTSPADSLNLIPDSLSSDMPGDKSPAQQIFDSWIAQNVIVHKELTADMKRATDKALKSYTLADILEAITNYGQVVNSANHFFNYRWTLEEFLTGGGKDKIPFGNLKRFLTESKPLDNFREEKNAGQPGKRDRQTAEPGKYSHLG